jgi:hypothetical protein
VLSVSWWDFEMGSSSDLGSGSLLDSQMGSMSDLGSGSMLDSQMGSMSAPVRALSSG